MADTTTAGAGADGLAVERLSRGALIRRRFFRNKLAVFGLAVIVLMFVAAATICVVVFVPTVDRSSSKVKAPVTVTKSAIDRLAVPET